MKVCAAEGCSRSDSRMRRGLCTLHYQRAQRGVDMGKWVKGDSPNYKACHLRVRASRGPASDYPCIDCGSAAAEWSYNRFDPNELTAVHANGYMAGREVTWSADVKFYEPRCVGCHRRFDYGRVQGGCSEATATAC